MNVDGKLNEDIPQGEPGDYLLDRTSRNCTEPIIKRCRTEVEDWLAADAAAGTFID